MKPNQILLCLITLIKLFSCEKDGLRPFVPLCPVINEISIENNLGIENLIITGRNFCKEEQSGYEVFINDNLVNEEEVIFETNEQIRILKLPTSPVCSRILVRLKYREQAGGCNAEGMSNPGQYMPPCPFIRSIIPDIARFGDTIMLEGENFCSTSPEDYTVRINGDPISNEDLLNINNGSTLQTIAIRVPKGIGSGSVTISFNDILCDQQDNSSVPYFTYNWTPTSSSVAAGTVGDRECPECFHSPTGIDVGLNGNVYFVDRNNHTVNVIGQSNLVSVVAGQKGLSGCLDHPFNALFSRFLFPQDIIVDESGAKLYVSDGQNFAIRRIDLSANNGIVCTIAGISGCNTTTSNNPVEGCIDHPDGFQATFKTPKGLTFLGEDILVTENLTSAIRKIENRNACSTSMGWPVTTLFGTNNCFFGDNFGLINPVALCLMEVDSREDLLLLADQSGSIVVALNVLPGNTFSFRDTIVDDTYLDTPVDVIADNKGFIYVCDFGNNNIIQVAPNGTKEVFVGRFSPSSPLPAPTLSIDLNAPEGIAIFESDQDNFLYVSDTRNGVIRKIKLE